MSKKVCVRVDCNCRFSSEGLYHPKDIIGFHRIDSDDPRAKVGSRWAVKDEDRCGGKLYPVGCEVKTCDPYGEVVEVIADCADCPNTRSCSFDK